MLSLAIILSSCAVVCILGLVGLVVKGLGYAP